MLQQGAANSSKAKRKRPADAAAAASPANGKKEALRAVPLLEEMPKWSVVREVLQVLHTLGCSTWATYSFHATAGPALR